MNKPRPKGLRMFDPATAPLLHETGMMSAPTMDPPAMDQLVEFGTSSGYVVKALFRDPDGKGMSLVWSWFAPHYTLPRHSHSGSDCIYYVTKGELHMGNRVVREGEGFFVPDGAPYAYTAGRQGVEILEFRGTSSFDMSITESLPRWNAILETVRTHNDEWSNELPAHQ